MMELNFSSAEIIAYNAFKEKTDKSGKPYIEHCKRVVKGLDEQWSTAYNYVRIAALLHDLIEDCPEWNFESLEQIFGSECIDLLKLLTRGKNQDYFEYIEKIKSNHRAVMIKKADLLDNMDITRLEELTEKDLQRLVKYHKAYKILNQ